MMHFQPFKSAAAINQSLFTAGYSSKRREEISRIVTGGLTSARSERSQQAADISLHGAGLCFHINDLGGVINALLMQNEGAGSGGTQVWDSGSAVPFVG